MERLERVQNYQAKKQSNKVSAALAPPGSSHSQNSQLQMTVLEQRGEIRHPHGRQAG